MQRNKHNNIHEFLVVAFVLKKKGKNVPWFLCVDISTRNVIHLPVAAGSLRH